MSADQKLRYQMRMAVLNWIVDEGISQTEAARRLGLTQPSLSAYLTGARRAIGLETLLDAWERIGGKWELRLGLGDVE